MRDWSMNEVERAQWDTDLEQQGLEYAVKALTERRVTELQALVEDEIRRGVEARRQEFEAKGWSEQYLDGFNDGFNDGGTEARLAVRKVFSGG